MHLLQGVRPVLELLRLLKVVIVALNVLFE